MQSNAEFAWYSPLLPVDGYEKMVAKGKVRTIVDDYGDVCREKKCTKCKSWLYCDTEFFYHQMKYGISPQCKFCKMEAREKKRIER